MAYSNFIVNALIDLPQSFHISHDIWYEQSKTLNYRMFPLAIDIIPTSLAAAYSNGKYTN